MSANLKTVKSNGKKSLRERVSKEEWQMRVDLAAFARMDVLGLAMLLTVAAILGKQACSLGALGRKLDTLSIGIGMVPRGEVVFDQPEAGGDAEERDVAEVLRQLRVAMRVRKDEVLHRELDVDHAAAVVLEVEEP